MKGGGDYQLRWRMDSGVLLRAALPAVLACGVFVSVDPARAADVSAASLPSASELETGSLADVLAPGKWREVESSVDRALAWLAARQAGDGSFPSISSGQPAVTSLCIMAFLSRGHQPGVGPYGERMNRAIDYVIRCQRPDGLLCRDTPGPTYVNRTASHTAYYNHGISGLMLGEVYGQVTGERAKEVKQAIGKALQFTRDIQTRPKPPLDRGGWRYPHSDFPAEADVSVTAWHLMFLRSAKNAEFDVPQEQIEEGLEYIRRCFDPRTGMFYYALPGPSYGGTRGTVGAGILSLSMGGQHQTPMALAAGDWLLAHPVRNYGEITANRDKFIYAMYYCSQATAQLGGRYWERFFPRMVDVLLGAQAADGHWPAEPDMAMFGNELTTAMAVLSLTPPYQLLPVYQR